MSRIVSLLSFDDPPNFEAGFGRIGDIRGSSEVPGVNRGRVSPSDVDLKLKKICLQFYKGQMTGKNHDRIQLSCFNFDVIDLGKITGRMAVKLFWGVVTFNLSGRYQP